MILTDDLRASDLEHMPRVNHLLVDQGMTLPNFATTTPTCCPSRASFLRGQYAHNHRVGHGMAPRESTFRELGLDRSTVGTWADDAGYRTGYVGKYLNKYEVTRVPPGWNRFYANFDRDVWARTFNVNGTLRTVRGGNIDAHLGAVGDRFLANNNPGRPFFLFQNFNAPHRKGAAPPPAPKRDLRRFADHKAPRTPAFNRVNAGMHPYFAGQPRLDQDAIRGINIEHRGRLASLQVVDRAIRDFIDTLREKGELQNTFIFFTSDNGYHMGERRLAHGKMTPLLSDVRVPLVVRGPGVAAGTVREELVQNTDFGPTVAEIAGAQTPGFVDGRSLLPLLQGQSVSWRTASLFEGRAANVPRAHLGFSGLTTRSGDHYIEYPDEFREFYDLGDDPHLLRSLSSDPDQSSRLARLAERLDALRGCAGAECRDAEDEP